MQNTSFWTVPHWKVIFKMERDLAEETGLSEQEINEYEDSAIKLFLQQEFEQRATRCSVCGIPELYLYYHRVKCIPCDIRMIFCEECIETQYFLHGKCILCGDYWNHNF